MSEVTRLRELYRRHHEVIGDLQWLVAHSLAIGSDCRPEHVEVIVQELRLKIRALQMFAAKYGDVDLQEALDSMARITGSPLPRHPDVANRIARRARHGLAIFGAGGGAIQ